LLWKSHDVFIAHEFSTFYGEKSWSVTLFLWYFELHCEVYSNHFIQLKNWDMMGHDRLKPTWARLGTRQAQSWEGLAHCQAHLGLGLVNTRSSVPLLGVFSAGASRPNTPENLEKLYMYVFLDYAFIGKYILIKSWVINSPSVFVI
jgi:hypothetical protein